MIIKPVDAMKVLICTQCGRGFMPWTFQAYKGGEAFDQSPEWFWNEKEGNFCGGEIKQVDRLFAIKVADQIIPIGGSNGKERASN